MCKELRLHQETFERTTYHLNIPCDALFRVCAGTLAAMIGEIPSCAELVSIDEGGMLFSIETVPEIKEILP